MENEQRNILVVLKHEGVPQHAHGSTKAALSGEKDPKPPANETQDLKNSLVVVAVKKSFPKEE